MQRLKAPLMTSTESEKNHSKPVQAYRHIAFVDPSVPDYQYLAASVLPEIDVVILDPLRDGILQITEALATRHNIESIHIISRGAEASLQLGATQLDIQNLWNYAREIRQWDESLSYDAEILLYGCRIAADITGWLFVRWFSYLTRATIAASAKLTGSATLGGNWDLEVTTGTIQTKLAFPESVREAYAFTLATI